MTRYIDLGNGLKLDYPTHVFDVSNRAFNFGICWSRYVRGDEHIPLSVSNAKVVFRFKEFTVQFDYTGTAFNTTKFPISMSIFYPEDAHIFTSYCRTKMSFSISSGQELLKKFYVVGDYLFDKNEKKIMKKKLDRVMRKRYIKKRVSKKIVISIW